MGLWPIQGDEKRLLFSNDCRWRAMMAQDKGLRKECSELVPDNEILIAPDRTC